MIIAEILICFFIAVVISFVGSVQFGPVNLKVIQATYNYNFRSAMVVAWGGIIPEIIYSAIAVWSSWLLLSNELVFESLQLIAIPFFLISGIFLVFKKSVTVAAGPGKAHSLFLTGFMAGALNPMLFTFWFMIINFLVGGQYIQLDTWPNGIAFVAGTALGAFLLLWVFAAITHRNKKYLETKLSGNLDKLIGLIFITLAVVQFFKWLA